MKSFCTFCRCITLHLIGYWRQIIKHEHRALVGNEYSAIASNDGHTRLHRSILFHSHPISMRCIPSLANSIHESTHHLIAIVVIYRRKTPNFQFIYSQKTNRLSSARLCFVLISIFLLFNCTAVAGWLCVCVCEHSLCGRYKSDDECTRNVVTISQRNIYIPYGCSVEYLARSHPQLDVVCHCSVHWGRRLPVSIF